MTVALNSVARLLIGYVVVGDGATFTATSTSGDWPATTRLRVVNHAGVETAYTPVIATTLATWTLTVAEVTALVGTKTSGQLTARVTHGTGDALRGILTGEISILTKWRGVRGTQSLGTVVVGPAGPPGAGEPGPGIASVAVVDGALVFTVDDGLGTTLDPVPLPGTLNLSAHPTFTGLVIAGAGPTPPANHAPEVVINSATCEDLDATVAWTGTDADSDPLTYVVAWGDDATTDPATSPATHTYTAGGEFTVTVTASDGTDTGSDTATVTAVDPDISAYHAAVMTDAPIVYYPLDDVAAPPVDAAAGSTATVTTGPTFGAVNIGDGATSADFAASSAQRFTIGQPAALNNLAALTIEALIEPDSNVGSGGIVARDDASSLRSFYFQRNSNNWQFYKLINGSTNLSTTAGYNSGSRYHVAVVYDGAAITIYVNGVSAATAAATGSLGAVATDWAVGAKTAAATAIDGRLAGVAIYNKALTPARLLAHTAAAGL